MNPSPDIQIAYRCDVCEKQVVENAFDSHGRARELGVRVCKECAGEAEAFAVGLVVDSVTRPDPVAEHTFKTAIRYSNNGTEFTPYNRTNQPFEWAQWIWIDEYRPPTHRVSTRWSMLIIGLITIAAGFSVANWWVG